MTKWGDMQERTLAKLNMTSHEASRQNYSEKMRFLANECLNLIANDIKPRIATIEVEVEEPVIVTLTEDFLSFSDLPIYLNGERTGYYEFKGYNNIRLYSTGTYTIYYNALWNNITEEDASNDIELEVDESVLMCLPSYIASQLLVEDNMVRSSILRNEFETMIDRLDVNENKDYQSFESEGGWY